MTESADQFDQLRLIRSPNIGPVTDRQLIERFGGAKAVLDAVPDLVMRRGGKSASLADPPAVEREMTAARHDADRRAVFDLMSMTYVSVDELVRQSGASRAVAQMVLIELELAGKLERGAGGKVRLVA